ncbi:MAG TPA: NTP transferase domain-containing protein [Terracidiphilus sp.]|nr:NTP transferase domain-containing protein [Terracidiphilus sp.]
MSLTTPIAHNCSQERLAAIVLAAGASSRMGCLKPLLRLGGVTALERSIALFHDAGIDEVLVVLGNRSEELRSLAESCRARTIQNAKWEEGMYSSVVAGVRALPERTRAAFVLPADVPMVRPATIRQIVNEVDAYPEEMIVYPAFEGKRGHPPMIGRHILDEAARDESVGPLCAVLAAHEQSAIDVAVADEAIHRDMDTPADFEALQALAMHREIPTIREREAILGEWHVPAAVVRHSRKVAEVAGRIADALAATGHTIDPELARAGGLLHDLAKGQPKHADAGAAVLRAYGMPGVANVVAAHTEMEFSGTIDEQAIVYLADKLVGGERLVTLDERFGRALDRFRDNANALGAARRRREVAEKIASSIEARLGMPIDAIVDPAPASIGLEG